MIMYATKQTAERLNLPLVENFKTEAIFLANSVLKSEEHDDLLKWGLKLFYFDRRKCVQAVNFASKFAVFMVDLKVADNEYLADMVAHYILYMYKDDEKMKVALEKFFEHYPITVFAKLKDKGSIAALNANQRLFLQDGYRVYDFIEDNVIQTRKLNKAYNFNYPVVKKGSKGKEFYYPADEFKRLIIDRFG